MTVSRVHTRYLNGLVRAYELSVGSVASAELVPAAVFPVPPDLKLDSYAVAPDLSRALYATVDRVTCIDRGGVTLWQLDFDPASEQRYNGYNGCDFSLDGTVVWVFRPDAMVRRGTGSDQWLAVDAGTGRVLAQADLGSAAHAGEHFAHPNGVDTLLCVGEGQDGSRIYRGRLSGGRIDLFEYPWEDRALVSVTPDGSHFMTVHHEQQDAAFHTYPDGAVVAIVPIEAFGHDPYDAFVEWVGGYLDDNTAVVTVAGETEDEREWFERYLVDPRTGEVGGRLDTPSAHQYDFEPLGDGSWLTTADDGELRRHTR